jgi:hypothetical protein
MRKRTWITKILRAQVPAKFFLGSVALVVLTLASCKKDTNVGLNVQPAGDLLNSKVSDTTSIVSWSRADDPLHTGGGLLYFVLGNYWDPIFGKAQASIYTQFVLPGATVNVDFDLGHVNKNLSCDSLVMTLAYIPTYYGDTNTVQTVKVFQLTDDIVVNVQHRTDTAVRYNPVPVGVKSFYPRPNTKNILKGNPVGTHIRIPIDKSLGQWILDQSGQAALASDASFVSFIKGFNIQSTANLSNSGKGAMIYLPMTDTLTKLTLYYRNHDLPSVADTTLSFSFEVNGNAARFAHFDHDYSVADPLVQSELAGAAHAAPSTYPNWLPAVSPGNEPIVFVSSLSGLKTKIDFPNILNWRKLGPISVNKAELTIKAIPPLPGAMPVYAPVGTLALVNLDSLGQEIILIDNIEGVDYFGGTFDAVNNQYVFHLDRYMQQILSGKQRNLGLYLVATSSAVAANRVVLGGANNTSGYKMNLRLSYTLVH